jgi:hypothetical protein
MVNILQMVKIDTAHSNAVTACDAWVHEDDDEK